MGITVTDFGFDTANIASKSKALDTAIQRRLCYIGEEMCNHARTITPDHESGGYNDQTHNLRSSIGYRVYKNGEKVADGGFQTVDGGDGTGVEAAQSGLDAYAGTIDTDIKGWMIVIVAGMHYAKYVEDKGYNVLHLTEAELNKQIEELKKELFA